MNRKNLLRRIGGFFLAASLLCGVALMSNTAVQAQRHDGGFHGREFHGRVRHGGFHTRIIIGPRFGWGNRYGYYGYHYRHHYGYPYRHHYRYFRR